MKRTFVAVFLFLIGLVATAVWFSPLAMRGGFAYDDNEPIERLDGLCYDGAKYARIDFDGNIDDMMYALDSMLAVTVKETESGGTYIVYAYSPRVFAVEKLGDGREYNVMAAYSNGHVCIGTPVLSGSY